MHSLPAGNTIPPYTLKVSARRRTLGLRIDHRGLTVHVPKRLPKYLLEQFLRDKSNWITRKLKEWADRSDEITSTTLEHGTQLHYLGNTITLQLHAGKASRAAALEGAQLNLTLPDPADTATVRRKIVQWYAKQARVDFERRIALLAARLGVATPPLFLSSAKTRWGSCNSRGEIRLNWRLIQAPPHIIHYVVAHELAHLKEMNHSASFWAWVGKLCPEYLAARQELKALSAQLHVI
jgi:hypothetical protein